MPNRISNIACGLLRAVSGFLRVVLFAGALFILFVFLGYWISLRFIRGNEEVVPNLIGRTITESLEELKDKELYLQLDKQVHDDVIGAGEIISQFPSPLTKIKAHTPIRVVVSRGPRLKEIPDVRAMSEQRAGVEIRKNEMKVGKVIYMYHEAGTKEQVIALDPPAHSKVEKGTAVNLLISSGKEPPAFGAPDLRNLTAQEARAILKESGFAEPAVKKYRNQELAEGLIFEQNPKPGVLITLETPLELYTASRFGLEMERQP